VISTPVFAEELIGRDVELGFLLDRFRKAALGQGALILISGEAGIGKTRLIAEFRKALADESAHFLSGDCAEYARAPYSPFDEALAMLAGANPNPLRSRSLGGSSGPIEPGGISSVRIDDADRAEAFGSLWQWIAHAAKARPIVLVIEDVHWADNASLALIEHIARFVAKARVLLIVSYRSNESSPSIELDALRARVERLGAFRIDLRQLTTEEIYLLASSALRGHGGASPRVVQQIEMLADGNPLFAEELLRGVIDRGADPFRPNGSLSPTLRASVRERLARFGHDERAILLQAAVIGRRFSPELLSEVVGEPLTHVLQTLREARHLQLISPAPDEPLQFVFRHALTREVLYDELLPAEAVALHLSIASKLESSHDGRSQAELAYHWAAARVAERAVHYNELAGDEAMQVIAYADAAQCYRTALGFDPAPARRRAALTEKLAYALYKSGAGDDTREWLDRARLEYEALGEREKMAQLLLWSARQCWNDADTMAGLPMAARSLELLKGTRNAALRAYAWVMMASYAAVVGDAKGAFDELSHIRPRSLSRRPDILGRYFDARGVAHAAVGSTVAAAADFERALAIADRSLECDLIVRTNSNYASFLVSVGKADEALVRWTKAAEAAQRERLTGRLAYAQLGSADVLLLLGDIAQAARLVRSAIASGAQNASVQILAATVGVTAGLMLGDEGLVATCARERALELAFSSTESQRIGPIARAFVDRHISEQRPDLAGALLRRAIVGLRTADQSWWLLVQAALYGDETTRLRARVLLAEAAARPDALVAKAHLALFDAAAVPNGERSEPIHRRVREAAGYFAQRHWPYHEAKALELARDLRGALEIYRRIGDRRDAERIDAALMPRHRRGRTGTSLTSREDEVVRHVADGKSNREIASMLGISERTVEHHVEAVFNRLGIHSRAQLIALQLTGRLSVR